MPLSRRHLLGLGGGALLNGCRREPLVGEVVGGALAQRAHRLLQPPSGPLPEAEAQLDVLIAGAGVAGLMAAWRLAGAGLSGRIIELADQPGGTAIGGSGPAGPFPWGAHYLTLPGAEAPYMLRLLAELGVIQGQDAAGRPLYDPLSICFAPQERLWVEGQWIAGLWPEPLAGPEDQAQRDRYAAHCAELSMQRGRDGRPLFAIPMAASSQDSEIQALWGMPFDRWLDQQGYSSALLRWWIEYGCLDDYGTRLGQTSAWAGLHYHCARRPLIGEELDTEVLTWPAGNGWLVEQLQARCPFPVESGTVTRASPEGRVEYIDGAGRLRGLSARQVILALPTRAARRVAGLELPRWAPQLAPWTVAQLQVDDLLPGPGLPAAWDSVIYGARSLGYVSSSHQSGRYGGPGYLTWYCPHPGEPSALRRGLASRSWAEEVATIAEDLSPAHPDLLDHVRRIDVMHWGHGTARPLPQGPEVEPQRLLLPHGALRFAHADLSRISLFEEAAWQGIRAAEEALLALGLPAESWR